MSFPVNVGQIPISYNELPTGRPGDPNNKYTSRYLDVEQCSRSTRSGTGSPTRRSRCRPLNASGSGSSFTVSADIQNTGSVAGDDVVQLYTHEDDTSILQPVRKLEGFRAGARSRREQTKTVTFTLGRQNLGFYNDQGQFVVEPGTVRRVGR